MCGIFGIIWKQSTQTPSKSLLKETSNLIGHRGPDGCGIYAEKGIGLVHTRLSLVDLSSGADQPFWDDSLRYCLVFNGEIYNFKELRSELERQGIQFRSTSDTEVLLKSLLKYGFEETLPKLEGMFAFALYDRVEQTVVIARDRFGIKPLFIYDDKDAFIFASEVPAMRPWLEIEPDLMSISSYLQGFFGPTQGFTFYEGIKILPPGGTIKLSTRKGKTTYGKFFNLSDFWSQEEAEKLKRLTPNQLTDLVEEQLLNSIDRQMFADAKVGALCSGGVDSSLIMAMAAVKHNNLAIFHSNVVGPLSEYEAAAKLAKHLKLDLKTVEVRDRDFIDLFPLIMEHYGRPFIRHSAPFLKVSQLVQSSGVKAVLSGEGSDECYLGYRWSAPNIIYWSQKPFSSLQKLINRIFGPQRFPDYWQTSGSLSRKAPTFSEEIHNRFEVALESKKIRDNLQALKDNGANLDEKSVLSSLDLLNYNLRTLLHRNDSMGMSASIESRFPFLDCQVVKTAINMPYSSKIHFSPTALDLHHIFFENKWILRKVADRYLPPELSRRPKKNFPVNALKRFQISPNFFQDSYVSNLFKLSKSETQYLVDNSNHSFKLKLLHLNVWGDVCIQNLSKQSVLDRMNQYISIKQPT